ncbi:MAG: LPS-assembly protein LptD [Zetaproteobacteria bacterium]|nr:MAG: LPS-assembly protein LptD [Zetaproteobacteria bacterium]
MQRPLPLLLLLLLLIPQAARPAAVDLDARRVTRSSDGTITAEGGALLRRAGARLSAATIRYHPDRRTVDLYGAVRLRDAGYDLYAREAHYALEQHRGTLRDARIAMADAGAARARRAEQRAPGRFLLHDASFTTCRAGTPGGWRLDAQQAELDREAGLVTLHHATFTLAGTPLFYTPYWQYPLRRRSGLLTPRVGFGKRRGNELALPLYWAAAPNWDATLTPHWMEARGTAGAIELRHADTLGRERLQIEGLRDRQLGRKVRKAGGGAIHWRLAPGLGFDAHGRFVGDRAYLADFSPDGISGATRYLTSSARLGWHGDEGQAWISATRNQNLATASDAATLQILPRLESHHRIPLRLHGLLLGLDQQTTNFSRAQGSAGVRLVAAPWLELPWRLDDTGSLTLRLRLGGEHADYWLRNGLLPARQHRNSYNAALTLAADLERISDDGLWRHRITPILRYDRVVAPDQSRLARFDSAYTRLNMSNLLAANRFIGHDRVERAHRISLLLGQMLQHKPRRSATARTLFRAAFGLSYDLLRASVDPALKPPPQRPWSNLIGNLAWHPWPGVGLTAAGQFDPADHYWAYATVTASWKDERGDRWQGSYRQADRRYAAAAESLESSLRLAPAPRWRTELRWHYDLKRKRTRFANLALAYHHPCWRLTVEGYRNTLLAATSARSDTGLRLAFTIEGIGG